MRGAPDERTQVVGGKGRTEGREGGAKGDVADGQGKPEMQGEQDEQETQEEQETQAEQGGITKAAEERYGPVIAELGKLKYFGEGRCLSTAASKSFLQTSGMSGTLQPRTRNATVVSSDWALRMDQNHKRP